MSKRWGYVSSISFKTSDGQWHGPFGKILLLFFHFDLFVFKGHHSRDDDAWSLEEREGYTLSYLKGRSGNALDQLSLCWKDCGEFGQRHSENIF